MNKKRAFHCFHSTQCSATYASITSVQCAALVFDIMQKTVFNVAQKMALGSIFLQICFVQEKDMSSDFLFFVKPKGKMTVKVVRWQMSHLIFNAAEGPAPGLKQETLTE